MCCLGVLETQNNSYSPLLSFETTFVVYLSFFPTQIPYGRIEKRPLFFEKTRNIFSF